MENIKNYFKELRERIDFKFHPIALIPFIILLLTFPALKWLPERYAWENHLIENIQLVVLLITFALCLKTKVDKTFFNTLALVMVILFLREINCGRTVFFPKEGVENAFYPWTQIKYGYLAHPLYGAFMAASGLYFLITKSFIKLWNYFLHAKLAIYNWIFAILGIIFGIFGEKIGSDVLEEMTELLFYTSLMGIIYMQGFNKSYIETTEKYKEKEPESSNPFKAE